MNIKHLFYAATFFVSVVSCSENDIIDLNLPNEKSQKEEVVFSFNIDNYKEQIQALDSLEILEIPITVIGNVPSSNTRAGIFTPVTGTITNLGTKTTLFKYGQGDNLVPSYYCGTNLNYATLSDVYKIAVRYDLNDNYSVTGAKGEHTGWNGTYITNPQTRFQGVAGNTDYLEFYTFVYDIRSTLQGYSASSHYWVPENTTDVRIYTQIINLN